MGHHPGGLVSPDRTSVILSFESGSHADQVDYCNFRLPYRSGVHRLQHRLGHTYRLDLLEIALTFRGDDATPLSSAVLAYGGTAAANGSADAVRRR